MEVEQRVEDRCDLVNGTLVSCVAMAEDDDHTRLLSELLRANQRF